MFPARRRICLDCRVALPDGAACTWLSHQHDDLTGACERLIDRVWGAGREVGRDRPQGAATEPMVPLTAIGFRGRIEEAPTASAPLGTQRAVGFAVEVRDREAAGSPVMLRDGATVGFTVAGDDGRVLLVAPGGIQMAGDHLAAVERNRRRVRAYLRELAPGAAAPSPFPWDEVRLALLLPGDLVTVRAIAAIRPDPRGAAGYRQAPRSILVAAGVPRVERHG